MAITPQQVGRLKSIIEEMGCNFDPGMTVLDFGCGNGKTVSEFRESGLNGFGCDLELQSNPDTDLLQEKSWIRLIQKKPYRLPFEDSTFDWVVSSQVLEHVQDYPDALSEIHRILKKGGSSLHIFPARWKPIESHIFVPFASLLNDYWWLTIWAHLGIRNPFQKGRTAKEVALLNYDYIQGHTNYLTKKEIRNHVLKYFDNINFCEKFYLKYSTPKGHLLYQLSLILPFVPALFSTFRTRAIFFKK